MLPEPPIPTIPPPPPPPPPTTSHSFKQLQTSKWYNHEKTNQINETFNKVKLKQIQQQLYTLFLRNHIFNFNRKLKSNLNLTCQYIDAIEYLDVLYLKPSKIDYQNNSVIISLIPSKNNSFVNNQNESKPLINFESFTNSIYLFNAVIVPLIFLIVLLIFSALIFFFCKQK
jgi:hypothetical protein